jgi:hypothetical protein
MSQQLITLNWGRKFPDKDLDQHCGATYCIPTPHFLTPNYAGRPNSHTLTKKISEYDQA